MSEMVVESPAAQALGLLSRGVDLLLSLDRSGFGVFDGLDVLRELETQRRRLDAVDQDTIAHLIQVDAALAVGAANTAMVLVGALRISPGEASGRVRAAQARGPRQALTGELLQPEFPHVAAAQRRGTISAQHARVITSTVTSLPAVLRSEHAGPLEVNLVGHARSYHPLQVSQLGQRALAHLDPDGTAPRDSDHARRREVRLSANTDGSATLTGRLTPACLALAQAALGALSAPQPSSSHTSADPQAGADPRSQAGADPRTAGQRLHDGVEDAMRRLLADGGLPDTGGTPTTLLLTMTLTELETRVGTATTAHAGTLSIAEALRLAADAEIIPVLFTDTGGIITYGRARRTASPAQRKALAARDKGCTMPGCDRPPAWCQTHHIQDWLHGGHTNIHQMTLLCGHHHRSFPTTGWDCEMINNVPHWRPLNCWAFPGEWSIRIISDKGAGVGVH